MLGGFRIPLYFLLFVNESSRTGSARVSSPSALLFCKSNINKRLKQVIFMQKMQIYEYNGTQIEFEVIDGHVMANATKMCQVFGKRPSDWMRLPQTIRYVEAIKVKCKSLTSLIETRKGNSANFNQGTWIHEKLILKLAQWLDVDFEIWCDEKIAELIKNGNEASNTILTLGSHTQRPVQVNNAKWVNAFSFNKGGKVDCIEWNKMVSIGLTGKTPSELKENAKANGVPSKFRTSGKEVIRYQYPDKAAGVSIADYLHANGVNDKEAIGLANQSLLVVNKLLEIQRRSIKVA